MFSIRSRTAADRESVVSWVPDAAALYLLTGPRLTWPPTTAQLSEMESADLSAWVLAEGGAGDPVGHFDLLLDGEVARLGRVLIAPERRGEGLARVLIGLAVDQAKILGASEMRLNVIVGNEPAIRTYARAGFTALPQSGRADVCAMTRPL